MASRYSQRVDLENWNSTHALAVMSVPPGSRVLDLGTADGSVARALKDRGCTVWGIDCDVQAAHAAEQVCDRVIVADLEAPEAFDSLDGETFDVVLALDVLEHLRDPTPVLRRAATHLTPRGIAIVSIPNVTHGALRVSLLEGRFDYTEQGLLDQTHLRFFDRRSAERLMSEAGLTIEQNLRVRRELDETEIAVSKDGLSPELLDSLAADPDATTYQFVFVAGLKDGLTASLPGGMLAERVIAENDSLLKQYRALETYVKSVEADRTATIEGAARELTAHQEELARTQSIYANAMSENQALRTQFEELGEHAKGLEAERAARIEDAPRELKAHQDELARTQSIQVERDELRQELTRRTQENHQLQQDLRHSKADLVAKEAFILDLRQQVLAIDPLVAQRDQLLAEREQLLAGRHRLDDVLQELERRTQEAHRLHADFRQTKAEVVFKDAYVSELRQQVDQSSEERRQLSVKRKDLSSTRDRLAAEREKLLARQGDLETTVGELRTRRDQLAAERKQLLARQANLEATVHKLRVYTNSAGFRMAEGVIRRLRSFPLVFKPARAMARRITTRGATVD